MVGLLDTARIKGRQRQLREVAEKAIGEVDYISVSLTEDRVVQSEDWLALVVFKRHRLAPGWTYEPAAIRVYGPCADSAIEAAFGAVQERAAEAETIRESA